MAGGKSTVVRPFGLLGPAYRIRAFGLAEHRLSWVVVASTLASQWLLHGVTPLVKWAVLGGGLAVVLCLQIAVVLTGTRMPPSPENTAQKFD